MYGLTAHLAAGHHRASGWGGLVWDDRGRRADGHRGRVAPLRGDISRAGVFAPVLSLLSMLVGLPRPFLGATTPVGGSSSGAGSGPRPRLRAGMPSLPLVFPPFAFSIHVAARWGVAGCECAPLLCRSPFIGPDRETSCQLVSHFSSVNFIAAFMPAALPVMPVDCVCSSLAPISLKFSQVDRRIPPVILASSMWLVPAPFIASAVAPPFDGIC